MSDAKPLRVLLVEDSPDDALFVVRELKRNGFAPDYEVVQDAERMAEALARREWDVVLSDHSMPRFSALAALDVLKAHGADVPFLIVSGSIGEDLAVEAMRAGACDFVAKEKLKRLGPALERELREAEDRRARRRAEEMFQQAQKMEAVGRLAGGVAHDFNNVLMAITGYSELALRRLPADDPLTAHLKEILKASERAAALTRQLLAFSRQEAPELADVDLNALVDNFEKMLRRLLGEDVAVELDLKPLPGVVHADPGQLEQVLLNLAVNARDAMPEGGRLKVATRLAEPGEAPDRPSGAAPGPCAVVSVEDSGFGMDAHTLQHLFEPFFTTKPAGKGTGLGLATVYGIVDRVGGHIRVESEPGQGSTFLVYLPLAEPSPRPSSSSNVGTDAPRGTETVLVVEDEEPVRRVIIQSLKAYGYRVAVASGVAEAREVFAARGDELSMLVSDVIMADGTGVDLFRELSARRPGLPVLFLSGYTDDRLKDLDLTRAGASFLRKPFRPVELVCRVREALDAAGHPA